MGNKNFFLQGIDPVLVKKEMPLLILVRHGACLPTNPGQLYGQHDIPLDPNGYKKIAQGAEIISHVLSKISKSHRLNSCLTSDISRCHHTALLLQKIINDTLNYELPFSMTKALREMHIGDWENAYLHEVIDEVMHFVDQHEQDPQYAKPPGSDSESVWMVQQRVMPILAQNNLHNIDNEHTFYHRLLADLEELRHFDEWLEEISKHPVELNVNIWVVHEGSAYAILKLLNVDCWEQNAREEFIEDVHQKFFTRGDILVLRPSFIHLEPYTELALANAWKAYKLAA